MVIVNVQRGGPSTGLPTKTEQADLLAGHVRAATASAPIRDPGAGRLPPTASGVAFEAVRIATSAT